MACHLATERVWIEKSKYHDAEKNYFEQISKLLKGSLNKKKIENPNQSVESYNNIKKSSTEESKLGITIPSKTKKNRKNKTIEAIVSEIPNKKPIIDHSNEKHSNITENNDSIGEETKIKKKKNKKKSMLIGVDSSDKLIEKPIRNNDENQHLLELEKDKDKKTKLNLKNKGSGSNQCTLVSEIAKARQHIKNSLERMDGIAALAASPGSNDVLERLAAVEKENIKLRELIESLNKCCSDSAIRLKSLEQKFASLNVQSGNAGPSPKVSTSKQHDDEDDDGVDLFGSDSEGEDAEAAKVREARLAAYAAKKSTKPALIAKSSLVLDVKPWDDETDLKLMEVEIRKISCDGLLWGASKFMPVAFGIQKLSISCVVEDDKVSIDWLTEEIEKFEDFVQSVDVAAFNKI